MGIVMEATRIDSEDSFAAYLAIPLDILVRPLEFIQLDCLREATDSHMALEDYTWYYVMIIPFSFAAAFAFHVLQGVNRSLHLAVKLLTDGFATARSAIAVSASRLEEAKQKSFAMWTESQEEVPHQSADDFLFDTPGQFASKESVRSHENNTSFGAAGTGTASSTSTRTSGSPVTAKSTFSAATKLATESVVSMGRRLSGRASTSQG